jgi:hypothetical protein
MVLDELKVISDDSVFTEEHIVFLANKYRGAVLRTKYLDVSTRYSSNNTRSSVALSNYQSICLNLIEVPAISGEPCEGGSFLRSSVKIPNIMTIGTPKVFPINYYLGEITFVSRERMRYVGHNKYLQNIIYASIGPDNYLYLKSSNPQYLYLEKIKMNAIFEDTEAASELQCEDDDNNNCDLYDRVFPLEESLVSTIIESIVKELSGALYKPQDDQNNAKDDLSNYGAEKKSK